MIKIISVIGSLTFLSRIFGYIRDLLIARFLGAGLISDSFFVAFKLPNLFRRLFAEGAMNSAFIPVLSGIMVRQGQDKSIKFLSKIISLAFIILFPLLIIFEIFMPFVINLIAPGFFDEQSKYQLTIELARLTMPFLLFISLSSLIGGFLNTINKFAAMAVTPVILNLTMICIFLIFANNSEINSLKLSQYLAFSISLAGLLQLIWLIINLSKNGYFLKINVFFNKKNFKKDKDTKNFFRLFFPAILGNGVYQLNLLIDMILASGLKDGSISYLYYADRINQLPLGVLGISLSTAMLPLLSKFVKEKKTNKVVETTNECLQLCFFISIPASFGIFAISYDLIEFLFVRGEFFIEDARMTSQALGAFCFGLPAFILVKILAVICFSREDTKTPVYIAFFAMLVNLVLNLILIDILFHVGLAVATTISSWFNAIMLYLYLKKRNFISLSNETINLFFKSFVSSFAMFVAIKLFSQNLNIGIFFENIFINQLVNLICLILTGIIIYILSMYFLKSSYLKQLRGKYSREK